MLEIKKSCIHGIGVFAKKDIKKGETITCGVRVISKKINICKKYQYPWDNENYSVCIGFGSFFNHSIIPNTRILKIDRFNLTKTFITLYDIKKDEELTIFYGNVDF